jgi:hypothetical protein
MVNGIREAVQSLERRIEGFELRVDARFESIDRRFEAIEHRLWNQIRWLVGIQMTTLIAVITVALVG